VEEIKQTQLDYGKALSWYLKDPRFWPTVLTMSLYFISCIFILPMFYVLPLFTGYTIAQIRKIQAGEYEILELNSSYWNEGVKLMLLSFAIGLVVGLIAGFFTMAGAILLASAGGNDASAGAIIVVMVLNLIGYLLQFTFSFALPYFMLLAYAIYAKTGSINSMLNWSNYKAMWRTNGWSTAVGYLIYYAGLMALTMIGMIACCIGILPASAAAVFIMAGVAGQFSVEGVE